MTKSEIVIFRNKQEENITSYLIKCMENVQDRENILYLSFFHSKKILLNKYEVLNRKNVTLINDSSIMLEDIEKYILEYKPKYVFVDYLKMTKEHEFYIQGKRLYQVRKILEKLEDEYGVYVLVVVNLLEDK